MASTSTNARASVIPDLDLPSPLTSPMLATTPTRAPIDLDIPAPIAEDEDAPATPRQAGPLPQKRGEIGFEEAVHGAHGGPSSSTLDLPARHPDERSTSPAGAPAAASTPAAPDTASTHTAGKRSLLSRLAHNRLPRVAGVTAHTFLRFVLQLSLLAGTLAGWALVSIHLNKQMSASSADPAMQTFANTAPIFVHVAFGIAFLAQALLLERCVFRMRAERWMARHPGEVLPQHARRPGAPPPPRGDVLALAPWNRPPVPTYAAALAETGVRGTGDVEDGLIAQAPPPAYGKTRGSVMVFAGFMSEAHRAQARLARTTSVASQASDRPASYMSHDSAWNERRDARRAQQLEDTLERLQHGRSSSQDSTRTVRAAPPPPAQVPPPRGDSLPRDNNQA